MLSRFHYTIKYENEKLFLIDGSLKDKNDNEDNKQIYKCLLSIFMRIS